MSDNKLKMERRLRIAGVLLVLGLGIDALSLLWNHPLAFLGFMFVGGLFVFLGIAVYLASLVFVTSPRLSAEASRARKANPEV
jgi:heme A synthase